MTLPLNNCLQMHEKDGSLILTLTGSVPPPRDTEMGVGLVLQSLQYRVTPVSQPKNKAPPHVETPGADIFTHHLGGRPQLLSHLACSHLCQLLRAPDPFPWSQSNPLGAPASQDLSQLPGPRLWH